MAVSPMKWRLRRWAKQIPEIGAFEPELQVLDDEDLRKRSLALKYRAKSREPLAKLLPEAYALVREAGRRTLNMRHFDVQLLGGIALQNRAIAEMQTGEGKTLTATLPLYLSALTGEGVHLATVNDYLAKRDADWMRPIYELLGMSVGIIQSQQPQDDRRKAYLCDVTYGTANEFGFDFLRDRLLLRRIREGQTDIVAQMLGQGEKGGEKPVQRAASYVLVDEADSILIDEARTPLIISSLPDEAQRAEAELYKWSAAAVGHFVEDEHYEYDPEKRSAELTAEGRRLVRGLTRSGWVEQVGMLSIYDAIERALKADRAFILDRHYVVRDGEIVIVDEFTGRLAEGRKWRDGLHQAIEAKENVKVTIATGHAARITIQDYFLRYKRLAGMTGTASTSARELSKIYKVQVVQIPTHRPPIRQRLATRTFGTEDDKFAAIVEEVQEMREVGRPVLIGTRSIDKSEKLSKMLGAGGVPHQVLNARHIAAEAEIVSLAGQSGRVTVSTNMAGRGTDVRLGPGVHEIGGMHVICTEMHDAARVDRQLIGRCGRQGDPGTYRQYLSLDDDILIMGLGPKRAAKLAEMGERAGGSFDSKSGLFRRAQRRIERRHFRDRKALMYHEKERNKIILQMGQDPYLDSPA
jgi:preprotein translocase subunit SecA